MVRYSFLSILPDDNADILAASLLISNCSFSSLILSSIVMVSVHIPSERLLLKGKRLSDAKEVSITKEEYGFRVHLI